MNPGAMMALAATAYFAMLAGFAGLATARALAEGDLDGLGQRVFSTITWTTFVVGLPTLIGFLLFLESQSTGHGGGIMSANMGLLVLFVFGFLALLALWGVALGLGFAAALVAKSLTPWMGAAVMAGFLVGAPVATLVMYDLAYRSAEIQRKLRR